MRSDSDFFGRSQQLFYVFNCHFQIYKAIKKLAKVNKN
jgi:hypothetical protein